MDQPKKPWKVGTALALLSLLLALVLYRFGTNRAPPAHAEAPPPQTNQAPLDLAQHFNGEFDQQWNPTTYAGDNLASLPRGTQVLAGVTFDLRGVIQLQGRVWKQRGLKYPEKVEGIPVGRTCRRLHLLHGTGGFQDPPGAPVAGLVLHYNDGTAESFEILQDIHVKDWWAYKRPPPSDRNTVVAWTGENAATARMGNKIRLYMTTFENPQPGKKVETVDYVSAMAGSGPFMVALTVE